MALLTPQDVLNRARKLGYISTAQYSDTVALEDYNIVRQELSNLIMQDVNENYFSEIIRTSGFVGQNEYALTDDSNNVDVNKVEDVFIKYSDDADYIKAYKQNKDSLPNELSTYNDTQSPSNPFYYMFADSVFIYPAIEEAAVVTNGIKLEVSLTPTELAIAEPDTLFPREYIHLIALGMLPFIYQRRGLIQESNNAQSVFTNAQTDMILSLSDRVSVPQEFITPNLSYFE